MISSYFQTDSWGEFKAQFGWSAKRYDELLGLERRIFGSKTILYFPEIPLDDNSVSTIKKLVGDGAANNHIFVRFDFLKQWDDSLAENLKDIGLIKSFEEIQPEFRQWLTLEPGEAEILSSMKPKGRYNISIAKKNQLVVKAGLEDNLLDDFYQLYLKTASRSGFSGRGKQYFKQLLNTITGDKVGEIVAVYQGSEVLAAGIFIYYKSIASYLYGASGGNRNLMAPYLMHWEAIRRAKKQGCKIYDLLAVAPEGAPADHPYEGLTQFKQRFGGERVRVLGSWDLVRSGFWYNLYRIAEKRRRKSIR